MGVLEHTGERVYVPPPRVSGMLGERPDVPRADYGMDYLRDMVGVADNWFVFGKPPEPVFVHQPELITHSKLSADLMHAFWRNTFSYAPGEALAAVDDIQEVARGEPGTRRTVFELPFEMWDREEKWVSAFIDELHGLLMANRPGDVLRDDRLDYGGYPDNPHFTEVRMGLLGASTVLVITRSRIARDEHGREVIARLVEVAKPEPDSVDDILCELSLIEQLRLVELLLRADATEDERNHVMGRADRRNMQRDQQSVRAHIEQFHFVPKPPLWRKVAHGLGNLTSRAADTSLVRLLAREKNWRKRDRQP